MPATDYLANEILDHQLGTGSFSAPASVHLALFTAAPNAGGGGTEVAGSGYAREEVTFGAAADREAANDAPVSFAAVGGNWGVVTHWGLFDASSSGNLLHFGPLVDSNGDADPQTINDGDSRSFAIGTIVVTSPIPA